MKPTNASVFTIPTHTRGEVMTLLQQDPEVFRKFLLLSIPLREELIAFCMGNRGLKLTYDPFFKEVFSPVENRGRLEHFLSCLLGQTVIIRKILPNESRRLAAGASLIIMDILVECEDGGLINLELQKVGYDFPGQRCACYSSDLVMREYARIRGRRKKKFSYRDMQRVITVLLIESSGAVFHETEGAYLHRFRQTSDTGLPLDLLQEYIFVALDVFKEIHHNVSTELDAWMVFLSSDEPADIFRLVEGYPYFKDLYQDILSFQQKPEELVNMFSRALEIMDQNTIQYMIEERDRQLGEARRELAESRRAIAEKQKVIADSQRVAAEKDARIRQLEEALARFNDANV